MITRSAEAEAVSSFNTVRLSSFALIVSRDIHIVLDKKTAQKHDCTPATVGQCMLMQLCCYGSSPLYRATLVPGCLCPLFCSGWQLETASQPRRHVHMPSTATRWGTVDERRCDSGGGVGESLPVKEQSYIPRKGQRTPGSSSVWGVCSGQEVAGMCRSPFLVIYTVGFLTPEVLQKENTSLLVFALIHIWSVLVPKIMASPCSLKILHKKANAWLYYTIRANI